MPTEPSVELQLPPELLRIFFPLLQEGVEVDIAAGCSIKQLLTEQFGIPAEYIASRITTLFLNSRAVDNAATALVQDGAVLALSGAMPGLVGATMRSGGFYAAMRGAMTYRNDTEGPKAARGRIKLKIIQPAPRRAGSAGTAAGDRPQRANGCSGFSPSSRKIFVCSAALSTVVRCRPSGCEMARSRPWTGQR